MTSRASSGVGLGIVVAYLTGVSLALWLGLQIEGADNSLGQFVPLVVGFGAFAVLGAFIVSRQPHNPMGWLFATIGLMMALFPPLELVGTLRLQRGMSPGFLGTLGYWANSWYWFVLIGLVLVWTPLLFPTGQLLSRWWRPVAWLAAGSMAAIAILGMLPETLQGQTIREFVIDNPIGVAGLEYVEKSFVGSILFTALVVSAVGAVASFVVRFRRSRGDERQQLKWFVFAVSTIPPLILLENAPFVSYMGFPLALMALSTAAGVAILKYRLYDIDVVISKTVVFAGLATFITAVYVAIVVGVGSLVGAGGEPSLGLSIVATAVVAVAFQPARERLTRVANRLVYGRRATPYQVLSRFSSQLGETVATEQTLEHMARLLAEGTGAAHAQVWLKVDEQMRSAASWPQEAVAEFAPLVLANGSLPDFAEVDVAVAVSHDSQLLGALTITKKRGEPLTPTERSLVEDLAGQAGLVVRNVGLTSELLLRLEELRDSRRRLVQAQDGERRRLERDLHDGAQQQLVSLKIKLGLAKRLAERDGATQTSQLLDTLAGEADEAVAALRELAHGIYPPLLAAEGLEGALRARAAKAPIPVIVEADRVGRFSQEVEAAVYFCVLEAIQNAAKYAQPSQVVVRLAQVDGQLTFQVSDDGAGFDPTTTPKGHGLTNIADRLHALGGTLEISSRRGGGTVVAGVLPVAVVLT